jgi:hypothetical protein
LYYAQGATCVVLELTGGETCDGLNIGAGDWCLSTAYMWSSVEQCPPSDPNPAATAISASGSVVGHEGSLGVDVELMFPDEESAIVVRLQECDSLEIIPRPCPWP